MADFLLELRSEEIPARMQDKAREDLARLFAAELAKAGLSAANLTTYATPRRLALIAAGLPLETWAVSEETKGPKTSAPPQALEGFLRKTGLTLDQLVERDGVYFAVIEKPGRKTADVLAEAIPAIIRAFPWPKSQRWGAASISTESLRWVRPLQGIVAMLGEETVPCEVDGIHSNRVIYGHRFHTSSYHEFAGAGSYVERLRACHVIVDQDERRAIIRAGAEKAARDAGLVLVPDEGLVNENSGLTEWPVPMLGRFDPAYLSVPEEVIQLTARVNQKYFICRDAAGALANAFICTANIVASDGGAAIVAGNEKVLAARLSDAKFFWEQDVKVPLDVQAQKLSQIVFHEKLGTVADKVERVAKLARWLVEEGIIKPESVRVERSRDTALGISTSLDANGIGVEDLADMAERAARLCKADLVTGMVGEFPELQGLMGGYYARAQGEDDAVADAIRDHYKPVGQGDDVPTAPVTVAVSLADKLDTLFEFFGADMKPSGSRDPFAIRRAGLAIIELVTKNGLRLPVRSLGRWFFWKQVTDWNGTPGRRAYGWTSAYDLEFEDEAGEVFNARERTFYDIALHEDDLDELDIEFVSAHHVDYHDDGNGTFVENVESGRVFVIPDWRVIRDEVFPFLADRLKVQQREAGVRHDLIDAVFALGGEDDLVRLLARVTALQAFVGTDEGANLLAGYKRVANLLKQSTPADAGVQNQAGGGAGLRLSPENTVPEDAALFSALDTAEPKAAAAIEAEQFEEAMSALSTLRAPIDAFFNGVMVNDPDPHKRAHRIGLLERFVGAVHRVADFSKIEG